MVLAVVDQSTQLPAPWYLQVSRNFRQRHDHKVPFMHARMRYRQVRRVYPVVPVQQQVQVQGARPPLFPLPLASWIFV